jgi:hypothetical protein
LNENEGENSKGRTEADRHIPKSTWAHHPENIVNTENTISISTPRYRRDNLNKGQLGRCIRICDRRLCKCESGELLVRVGLCNLDTVQVHIRKGWRLLFIIMSTEEWNGRE